MPPKRKAPVTVPYDDDDDEFPASQGGGGGASQLPQVINAETADAIANKLCRYVLLHEHKRKPVTRTEMKAAVMSEHNDRSGKIFKQVLGAANAKLKDLAGLELVAEAGGGDEEEPGGTQAGAGASQSQAPASQAASQAPGGGGKAAKTGVFFLVNRLNEPVRSESDENRDDAPAYYQSFIEVVLSFIQQSDGVLDEEKLFGYLEQIGCARGTCLPEPAEQEKVESLIQKRLVGEAWLRRMKKPSDPEHFQYVAGARAALSRSVERADEFRNSILGN